MAKINLSLDVVGKRDDGYHLLDMIVQTVDLADTISIEKSYDKGCSFTISDLRKKNFPGKDSFPKLSAIPMDNSNLMVKAFILMKKCYPEISGVKMRLTKRIPSEAGLGGASSDAATVLKGINELFDLKLNEEGLEEIAARLGADVPFFIRGGTQRVSGIGEKLKPLKNLRKIPAFPGFVLILRPDINLSTPSVYADFDKIKDKKKNLIKRPDIKIQEDILKHPNPDESDIKSFLNQMENVLSNALPKGTLNLINEIKDLLTKSGAKAACMSGSGAAVYGLFNERKALELSADMLKRNTNNIKFADIIKTRMCSYL